MKIWASVDPQNINEEPYIVVLGNDWGWYPDCCVVGDATVLCLYGLAFKSGNVRSVYCEGSFGIVGGHGAVSDEAVL
jgi:hypothetical protein